MQNILYICIHKRVTRYEKDTDNAATAAMPLSVALQAQTDTSATDTILQKYELEGDVSYSEWMLSR